MEEMIREKHGNEWAFIAADFVVDVCITLVVMVVSVPSTAVIVVLLLGALPPLLALSIATTVCWAASVVAMFTAAALPPIVPEAESTQLAWLPVMLHCKFAFTVPVTPLIFVTIAKFSTTRVASSTTVTV